MTDRQALLNMKLFLNDVAETNEDTEFDPSQEQIVQNLIELVKERGKTSIVEDFETPYLHPMLTVQKWVEELKWIVGEALEEESLGKP